MELPSSISSNTFNVASSEKDKVIEFPVVPVRELKEYSGISYSNGSSGASLQETRTREQIIKDRQILNTISFFI